MKEQFRESAASLFDASEELVSFYERHFDELVESCLEASSRRYQWSPLNTLDYEERRLWVTVGFRQIMRIMRGEGDGREGRIYFPQVSVPDEASELFGMSDVVDSCECVLLPDEGILPLLWEDYAEEPEKLLALVMEFRAAQNNITRAHIRQQTKDFERHVAFVKKMSVNEERIALEGRIYEKFYLALRALRGKTSDLYDLIGSSDADADRLRTEVTQLKMMEADLLAEVFRINPELDAGHRQPEKTPEQKGFRAASDAHGLTDREREVAALVARGYSNKDISEVLSLAESTVKNYLSSALAKLGKENRAQIVVFAAEHGYFEESTTPIAGEESTFV